MESIPPLFPFREGHTGPFSLHLDREEPSVPCCRPTGLHTHTPEVSLVPPTPSGHQTSAQRRDAHAWRPASYIRVSTASSRPLVWLTGPSPALDLAQWTLNSQPIGAAKWGVCLQDQPQELCLPKGRGAQSSAGLGLVRENEVSRGWVSKSEHSTSGRGHLSRHTQESLGEKEEHTRVH